MGIKIVFVTLARNVRAAGSGTNGPSTIGKPGDLPVSAYIACEKVNELLGRLAGKRKNG